MRARKNVPPEIRLTEPRMPTAASNAREQKKKKKKNRGFWKFTGTALAPPRTNFGAVAVVKGTLGSQKHDAFFHFDDDDDDITTSRLVGAARRVGGAALVHRLLNSFSYGMNK